MTKYNEIKNASDMIRANFEAHEIIPLSNTCAWLNRKNQSIYEAPVDSPVFFKENEILHVPDAIAVANQFKKDGDLNKDPYDSASLFKGKYQSYADDYYKIHLPTLEYYKLEGLTVEQAQARLAMSILPVGSAQATTDGGSGAIHPDKLGLIERVNVLAGIMKIGEVRHMAHMALPRRKVEFIKGTFFKRHQLKAQRGIRPGKPILATQVQIDDQTYEISGIGTHVASHWEVRLLPYYVDALRESLDAVAQAITEAKAEDARDTIQSHGNTPVTVTSWSAKTGGESTNDPVIQLEANMQTITQNGGNTAYLTMAPTANAGFETNRWRNEADSASMITSMGQSKQYTWRGLKVTVDPLFAADKAWLYSANAYQGYDGPIQSFDYKDVHTRIDGDYYLEYSGDIVSNSLEVVELDGVD